MWRRPFGLPISVQLDSDGAFLSTTQEWHVNIGVEYLVIPAEAWQLGKIGRRNALMRTLAERLIDQNGATATPFQVGRRSVKVGSAQLRPAAAWENWTPSKEDLDQAGRSQHDCRTLAGRYWRPDRR